tara:strand:+ start:100 stop:441 length:342 start_codon:yes stop_codon:yes gene_type:complete
MKILLLLPLLLGVSGPAFALPTPTPAELKKIEEIKWYKKNWESMKQNNICEDFVLGAKCDNPWCTPYTTWAIRKKDGLIFSNNEAQNSGAQKTFNKYCKNPDLPWAPWKEPTS